MSGHLPMEETDVLRKAEDLSDTVWDIVAGWKSLSQDTVGKQLIRASDSIGANLVEGDGRYSDGESIHFFVIARASAREASYWLRRAKRRSLIQVAIVDDLLRQIEVILKSINGLITYRRNRSKSVREEPSVYQSGAAPNALAQHLTLNT